MVEEVVVVEVVVVEVVTSHAEDSSPRFENENLFWVITAALLDKPKLPFNWEKLFRSNNLLRQLALQLEDK